MEHDRCAPIQAVITALTRLRARVRALVLAQRVALVLAVALGACLATGLVDYVLRTPAWMRAIVWADGLSALAWAAVKVVWPAVKFRPALSELALRVEREAPGAVERGPGAADQLRTRVGGAPGRHVRQPAVVAPSELSSGTALRACRASTSLSHSVSAWATTWSML